MILDTLLEGQRTVKRVQGSARTSGVAAATKTESSHEGGATYTVQRRRTGGFALALWD